MRKDALIISCLGVSALTALLTRASDVMAELYRTRLFLPISSMLRLLTSCADTTVVILVLLIILAICLRRGNLKRCIARALCMLLAPYWLLWGPLYNLPELPSARLSGDMLARFCLRLSSETEALLPFIEEISAESMMNEAERLTGAQTGVALSLSRSDRTALLDRLGLAGLYNPLTGMAHVSLNDQAYMLPFTMCHELAHQAGYAREDEANFIAYKACSSGNAAFRFSGSFNMLLYAMDMLYEVDRSAWRQCVNGMSDPLFFRFARCNGLYTARQTPAYRLSQTLTTLFLRMNGQMQGAASYKNAVSLVLANEAARGI